MSDERAVETLAETVVSEIADFESNVEELENIKIKEICDAFIEKSIDNTKNALQKENKVPDIDSIDKAIRVALASLMLKGIINKENILYI